MFASGLFLSIVVGIALFQNSSANYLTADDLGTVVFSTLVII